ncbi:Protein Red [Hypsizygus marmoreus]|uniref:Protein Red n=1 Tax=Hypsizygus marmoreus TaxID=39966 RepID=A0A369JNS1_HYPMA|nr:Protein Red [Hypsizygus marmoreus]
MDQDSFRQLLQTPHPSTSTSTSRGSLLASGWTKSKTRKVIDPTQPAFKPRKVKKPSDSQYRDRAAERRVGGGSDYAEVEAVLEDFEKRNAGEDKSVLDQQRRYLGGDSDHSILVKGLDIALLEQNRARAAATSTEDDDELEQAFQEVASSSKQPQAISSVPKKRTREDLIRELKEKRAQNGVSINGIANGANESQQQKPAEYEARLLEEAKKKGKFKPIGFKPIGASEEATKKKKVKEGKKDGERKKKKRKVETVEKDGETTARVNANKKDTTTGETLVSHAPAALAKQPEPQSEPFPDDFDIFADAGEYEGLQVSDSEVEDEERPRQRSKSPKDEEQPSTVPRRWIDTGDEPESQPQHDTKELLSSVLKTHAPPASDVPVKHRGKGEGVEEAGEEGEIEQQPTRLEPLESSALPSIKDFLAMEGAAGGGKRRKRGGKKGGASAGAGEGGGGGEGEAKKKSMEAKVERDYKRLKSYTDKKAGASK